MSSRVPSAARGVGLGLVGIMMMLILPVPPVMLDVLLAVSVTAGLLIFLLALNFGDPVEFSTFPSVLLIATMMRLSLNIASTRLILLQGHEGPDAAGSVIQAFGAFVVGGSYIVGIIVFLILVIINFKVITAGAGRISEVAARFTLDAMPGKQMAIDNDLANGHITETEARRRRTQVSDEADFYGAMDGANKFVKGDAVAGLVITAVNIIGGMIIGVAQNGLTFADAAETYTILTVGDGLVSQIPALLVSTGAGLIASRTGSGEDLGDSLVHQILGRREPLLLTGLALGGLALVPGMPTVAFLSLSGGSLYLANRAGKKAAAAKTLEPEDDTGDRAKSGEEPTLHDMLHLDLLALEVGFDLVPLVDRKRGGDLINRISGIRKQIAQEMGLVVPPIHVRDNLQLSGGAYRVLLSGTPVGQGELRVGRLLAINPGGAMGQLKGAQIKDPAFGMPSVWIVPGDRERAELLGYTVVEPAAVAATHLTELLKQNAAALLGRSEAQELIDAFAHTNPKVVEELIPTILPLGDVIKVLRNLLDENVSIRDLRSILEALADHGSQVKEPEALTEIVRQRLGRSLTSQYADDAGTVHALVLDPEVEGALRGRQGAGPDPNALPHIVRGLEASLTQALTQPVEPLLLTAADIRRTMATLASRHAPGLAVMSFREIDPKTNVHTLGIVKLAS